MRLKFKPRSRSSFDEVSGIAVPRARVAPATLEDGRSATEYQFEFARGSEVVGGLGLFGTKEVVEREGAQESVSVFDLSHDWLILYLMKLQQSLSIPGDGFSFLCDMANGLVMAYAGQDDNEDNLRYVAVTSLDALMSAGVAAAEGCVPSAEGVIILAEAYVPARAASQQEQGYDVLEGTRMTIPAPPVPARLRELLSDYPAHLEKLQHAITKVADEPCPSAPHIELVVWALEDSLDQLVFETLKEVAGARASGDTQARVDAERKELLIRQASLKQVWIDDPGLLAYAQLTRDIRG